jgi:chromosome segregation ATPase
VNIGAEVLVAIIGGLFGFLGGLLVFIAQNRRANFEAKHSAVEGIEHEASASEKSAEAVRIYAEQVINLAQQVEVLRNEIMKVKADFEVQLEKKNKKICELERKEVYLCKEIDALKGELKDVRSWAEKLCSQIHSYDKVPVTFERKFPS